MRQLIIFNIWNSTSYWMFNTRLKSHSKYMEQDSNVFKSIPWHPSEHVRAKTFLFREWVHASKTFMDDLIIGMNHHYWARISSRDNHIPYWQTFNNELFLPFLYFTFVLQYIIYLLSISLYISIRVPFIMRHDLWKCHYFKKNRFHGIRFFHFLA